MLVCLRAFRAEAEVANVYQARASHLQLHGRPSFKSGGRGRPPARVARGQAGCCSPVSWMSDRKVLSFCLLNPTSASLASPAAAPGMADGDRLAC